MTLRAAGLVVGGAVLVLSGWYTGWPELTAFGAAALALVAVIVVAAGPAPRVQIAVEQTSMRAVRGEEATIEVNLRVSRRWRWLRVVSGNPTAPVTTTPITKRGPDGLTTLRLPVDTSTRGERTIGPYVVVHGDPWSIVRRVAAHADGGQIIVHPRTFPIRRSASPAVRQEAHALAGRLSGDEHFYALRDYVLGDEPRMVHWRSSARAGKLVVKQHVASRRSGTMIVLDTDASAYGSDEQFGSGWLPERFEAAVEVAASFAVTNAVRTEQLHVVTTSRGASPTSGSAGAIHGLLDAFAAMDPVSPVDTAPEVTATLARRLQCARLILVTGTPGSRVLQAARTMTSVSSAATLVRVGAQHREILPALRVLDVDRLDDLVEA